MLLPALGAFALVGFKVTGPDMRATAEHYFAGYHLTDLTVIGDMGLDSDDEVRIEEASGIVDVEYGYLKDVTVSGTHDDVVAQIADGEADLADARATLSKLEEPAYNAYNRRETLGSEGYKTYDSVSEIVNSLNKIMGVVIVVATLLAIVIVYNLVTINVAERIRELSTVKVLGFFDGEVSMYIYRETIALSIVGVPVGWLFGRLLQPYIIGAVPPEQVMFDPATGRIPFVVSAVVVALVVMWQYFVVKRRLRNVDMLEALKSVDEERMQIVHAIVME